MTDAPNEDLGEAEQAVWSAYSRGTWVDLRTGNADADRLSLAYEWPQSRVVRAEVIAALLLGAGPTQRGSFPALRLRGARITGRLDLTGATVEHALVCEYCVFDGGPRFDEAMTRTLQIVESVLPSFEGARMRVTGSVDLSGSVIKRFLSLDQANVVGVLRLRGATIGRDRAVTAVSAVGLSIDGELDCDGFACTGAMLLRGARITGSLALHDASLDGAPFALRADNAVIEGRFSGSGLRAVGEVRLSNSRIAGWLNLVGARLRNPGDIALGAGGLSVGGGMWCGESFQARGEVRLIGARVGGNLNFIAADLSHPGGDALNLDRAALGDLDAGGLRVADSRVSLRNVRIGGRANFAAARLDGGAGKIALAADGAVVVGALDLRGARVRGEARLRAGSFSERILLSGAVLDNAPGIALRLSRTRAATDLFCSGMTVRGAVKLTGAQVGSHVLLEGVVLSNPGQVALDAENLQAGILTLTPR